MHAAIVPFPCGSGLQFMSFTWHMSLYMQEGSLSLNPILHGYCYGVVMLLCSAVVE